MLLQFMPNAPLNDLTHLNYTGNGRKYHEIHFCEKNTSNGQILIKLWPSEV